MRVLASAVVVVSVLSFAACDAETGAEGGGSASAGGGSGGGGSAGGGSAGGGSGGSGGGAAGGGSAGGGAAGGGSAGGGAAGGGAGGGSGDGGMKDGGSAGGSSVIACTGFCDGFEGYDAGSAPRGPWSASVAGGTVAVDRTRAHAGVQSVKVTTDGQAAYRRAFFQMGAPFFPVTNSDFYGRAWVWLTAAPPQTTHWTHIEGQGPVPDAGTNVVAHVRYGGQNMKRLMANYDTGGVATDCWQHSTLAMPEGKWVCYEWHFSTPNNRMELWVDGTAVTAITVDGQGQGCINNGLGGKWLFPQFQQVKLGWEHYQTSNPIEMWWDDVVLSKTRVGCGN